MALLRQAAASGIVRMDGEFFEQAIAPRPGSVVAAPASKPPEPDYFFHWVRDSALVMRELADLEAAGAAPRPQDLSRRLGDFAAFSRELQLSPSPAGLGEVRYNADGTQDLLKWSRPQFDGPALRALALMRYAGKTQSAQVADTVTAAVRADLDFIAANWPRPGFDLWEEYEGQNYYTLSVQAGALEEGARWAAESGDKARAKEFSAQRSRILDAMDAHWSAGKGYLGFLLGPKTHWDGSAREKPGDNLDSAVLLAALHSRRREGPHSLLDERVLATAVKVEDLFASLYAVNRNRSAGEGVVIGRYEGDTYYGGNPFVFITLGFAEMHYRLVPILGGGAHFQVTALNKEFLGRALLRAGSREPLEPGMDALAPPARKAALLRGLVLRGDDILRAVRRLAAPKGGGLSEQFDQESGVAPSSHDLSWSHAAFLSATDARRDALASLRANPD
jgi:glucoamylase